MVNQTPQIEPIVPAYRVRILSDEQLEKFKSNTFIILEETGFLCPSERALKIYAEHGAVVDFDTQIVKLSPDVILEALSHAPRYYTMGGRTEAFDLDLSKGVTYEATDGTGTKTIDYVTRKLRSSIKDDVAKSARISDYLSSISFYWPMVSAQDHPVSPHCTSWMLPSTIPSSTSRLRPWWRKLRHAMQWKWRKLWQAVRRKCGNALPSHY